MLWRGSGPSPKGMPWHRSESGLSCRCVWRCCLRALARVGRRRPPSRGVRPRWPTATGVRPRRISQRLCEQNRALDVPGLARRAHNWQVEIQRGPCVVCRVSPALIVPCSMPMGAQFIWRHWRVRRDFVCVASRARLPWRRLEGESRPALSLYREACQVAPATLDAWLGAGEILIELNRGKEAIQLLEMARKTHPTAGQIRTLTIQALALR